MVTGSLRYLNSRSITLIQCIEEVIILCCAQHKLLLDVPVKEIRKFTLDMLSYFEANHSDIIAEISVRSDERATRIKNESCSDRTYNG